MAISKGDTVSFDPDFSPHLIGLEYTVESDPMPDNTRDDHAPYVWLALNGDRRKIRSGYVKDLRKWTTVDTDMGNGVTLRESFNDGEFTRAVIYVGGRRRPTIYKTQRGAYHNAYLLARHGTED